MCTGFFQGELLISVRTSQELNGADKVIKRIVAGKGTGGGHLTYAGGQIPLKKGTESECKGLKRLVERRFLKSIGVSIAHCYRLLTKSNGTVLQ
jgi:hypothetical protein